MNSGMPVKGGVRKRRAAQPTMHSLSNDSSIVRYNTIGVTLGTTNDFTQANCGFRLYVPGNLGSLTSLAPGPRIVANYATGKFLPGTRVVWEPSVSFTTSGRICVAFTDNPEIMKDMINRIGDFALSRTSVNFNNVADVLRNFGNVQSFPVWQETQITVPTNLRRKRFDTNSGIDATNVDQLDRSSQIAMFYLVEGVNSESAITCGAFRYSDVVDVEGITVTLTGGT